MFQRTQLLNFTARSKPCPSLHYPPLPRKVHLWRIFFALPAINGPFSAELEFNRENTVKYKYSKYEYKPLHDTIEPDRNDCQFCFQ